tara:strand:+ start:1290 stop:3383 length:2094 start_codon:yes stop_codon:yes gene_type:complete
MIGFKAYRSSPTTLELDGPILSYTQQPTGITTESSTITLVGIATALPVGTGSISYQWYETGYGAVATSSTITGTATTALTLNELNYNDSGREFYLEASYEASAYGASPITAGTARSTGNAINAPLNSDTVQISLGPTIVILQQPVSSTVAVNNDATFSVLASIGSSTGAGVVSPCIAVIDETSPSQEIINEDWTAFRNKWSNRPFNIFRVARNSNEWDGVKLPSIDPTDYNVENVGRDSLAAFPVPSDWFTLANLNEFASGTTVTLWVDNSGSMRTTDVQASYDKFVTDCADAGIIIEYATSDLNGDNFIHRERYIWPFIDDLVGTSQPVDPNLVYQWKVNGENAVSILDARTVSGSNSNTLTINDTNAGIHTVACSISYPGAVNSPLLSNVVTYDAAGADVSRSVLHLEEFDVNADLYSTKVVNLEDEALEITPSTDITVTSDWNRIYSINAPEEDITVKITLKGAAGSSIGSRSGGQGGVSVWTMTLTRQQEYVVNLGAAIWPSGGAAAGGGNGGGGSFFYRGGELLVACGGGGGGGTTENGENGWGGGIGNNPVLTSTGSYPSGLSIANATERWGGRVASCTIGDYWATQGIAPCVSIGSTQFFTGKDGQKSTSIFTTPVTRGYKAGLNYQFNGGNGVNGGGGAGSGAIGGDGGVGGSSVNGGDGGNGFTAIAIDSATIGGNTQKVGTIKIEKA